MLIHGYKYHLSSKNVAKPELHSWQNPDSHLVKALAKNADVFDFAYGENVSIDTIIHESKLGAGVNQLRRLGYSDIVLLGHSAGGLIARQFVEDYPNAGVTKVVQVSAPNGGSPLANFKGPKTSKHSWTACQRKDV